MKQPVARLNDKTVGTCVHGHNVTGKISSVSQSTVLRNGLPIARVTDTVTCDFGCIGVIQATGSSCRIAGQFAARKGDSFSGAYSGTITEGDPTCNIA